MRDEAAGKVSCEADEITQQKIKQLTKLSASVTVRWGDIYQLVYAGYFYCSPVYTLILLLIALPSLPPMAGTAYVCSFTSTILVSAPSRANEGETIGVLCLSQL